MTSLRRERRPAASSAKRCWQPRSGRTLRDRPISETPNIMPNMFTRDGLCRPADILCTLALGLAQVYALGPDHWRHTKARAGSAGDHYNTQLKQQVHGIRIPLLAVCACNPGWHCKRRRMRPSRTSSVAWWARGESGTQRWWATKSWAEWRRSSRERRHSRCRSANHEDDHAPSPIPRPRWSAKFWLKQVWNKLRKISKTTTSESCLRAGWVCALIAAAIHPLFAILVCA